jgi:uncharacterized membrane protein
MADAVRRQRALLSTRAGRVIGLGVVLLGVGTAVALVALWPSHRFHVPGTEVVDSSAIDPATVTGVERATCPAETRPGCQRVSIQLDGGRDKGEYSLLFMPADEAAPRLSVGDRIRVTAAASDYGTGVTVDPSQISDPSEAPYAFVDYRRGWPLLWLVGLFAFLVVVLGRRIGALSLIGAVVGLLLVVKFVAPAILDGSSPLLVALVGAFAAMFVSIVSLYGMSAKSLASLAGTAVSLAVIGLLAVIGVHAAKITGTASEEATFVQSLGGGRLSLQGLVIAGMLIGALGVLNDVAVSQASTVLALRRANATWSRRQLTAAAMDVGRDHLGATVNTLVFAYAGAALPLLLVFSSQGIAFSDAVGRETVASEIVAAVVGSIGLICAVPLSTIAATALAAAVPVDEIGDDGGHGHAH